MQVLNGIDKLVYCIGHVWVVRDSVNECEVPVHNFFDDQLCNVRVLQKKKKSIKDTYTNIEYGSCCNVRANTVPQKNKEKSIHIQTLYTVVATM